MVAPLFIVAVAAVGLLLLEVIQMMLWTSCSLFVRAYRAFRKRDLLRPAVSS